MLEKIFKLKANNTSVKIEILAGLTTFMTMAYIVALNPNLIVGFDNTDPLWKAVFLATVLSAGIGTILMGILANRPFCLAPGMGLNSYFAVVATDICVAAGYGTYKEGLQAALAIVLISGILFTVLTVIGVREKIVDAIPTAVRLGIPAGIGLMLIKIGLTTNFSIYDENGNLYTMLTSFFNDGPSATKKNMGDDLYNKLLIGIIATFVGIFVICALIIIPSKMDARIFK